MRIPLHRWLQQLAAVLRFDISRAAGEQIDAAVLQIEGETAALLARRRGTTLSVARLPIDDDGFRRLAAIMAERGRVPDSLVLRFPSRVVLQKRMTAPIAAKRHLEGLLGYEMDRETPFGRDEVHWSYKIRGRDSAHGRVEVDLFVVARSAVDPIIELARRAGLDPVGLEFETGPGETMLIRLGVQDRWQWLRDQRPLVAMAALAGVLAIVAVAAPFLRLQRASAAVEAEIAALTPQATEAAKLRQSVDQLASAFAYLKRERERTGSPLSTLAAATRALPDDSYLTDLDVRAGRVTMTGQSPSAAQLVGSLAQSQDFREPAFESPVVQKADDDMETFTISVSLRAAGAP